MNNGKEKITVVNEMNENEDQWEKRWDKDEEKNDGWVVEKEERRWG